MFALILLLIGAIFYLLAMYKCEEHETRATICIAISMVIFCYDFLYMLAYGVRI